MKFQIYSHATRSPWLDQRPCCFPVTEEKPGHNSNQDRWHTGCNIPPVMKTIILCSSNPMLIKNLYGVLRDEGYTVETMEHPALAVKKVMWAHYDFVIVDSEPFGMSAGRRHRSSGPSRPTCPS